MIDTGLAVGAVPCALACAGLCRSHGRSPACGDAHGRVDCNRYMVGVCAYRYMHAPLTRVWLR